MAGAPAAPQPDSWPRRRRTSYRPPTHPHRRESGPIRPCPVHACLTQPAPATPWLLQADDEVHMFFEHQISCPVSPPMLSTDPSVGTMLPPGWPRSQPPLASHQRARAHGCPAPPACPCAAQDNNGFKVKYETKGKATADDNAEREWRGRGARRSWPAWRGRRGPVAAAACRPYLLRGLLSQHRPCAFLPQWRTPTLALCASLTAPLREGAAMPRPLLGRDDAGCVLAAHSNRSAPSMIPHPRSVATQSLCRSPHHATLSHQSSNRCPSESAPLSCSQISSANT